MLAGLSLCVLLANPMFGQDRAEVFPEEPRDGAVVGPHPVFQLGYHGLDDDALRDSRFRIALKAERQGDASFVFDQRQKRSGWTPGEPGRMLYRPRRPLPDGSYEWRVAIWDGLAWSEGRAAYRLRVDSIPPAPVQGLRVRYDHEAAWVELEWEPVTADVEGGLEFVALYHVYRYPRADRTPQAKPYEVQGTGQTRVRFPVEGPDEEKLWFYRVTAEDLAGNEAGRPE